MNKAKVSEKVLDGYADASIELFMSLYAETIPINSTDGQGCSDALQDKCTALIKKARRREKLSGFARVSGKLLKSAAVMVVAMLALSSLLFITVDAVRQPVMDFYVRKNDGNWDLTQDPPHNYNPHHNAPEAEFDETDPLGSFLPDGFYLQSIEGTLKEEMRAIYLTGEEKNFVSFHNVDDYTNVSINTENATVTEFELNGYKAILSSRTDRHSIILIWHRTDLNMYFTLHTDCLSEEDMVAIAETLNYLTQNP